MRGMKLLLAAALVLGTAAPAFAAQPDAREVDRLMEVMRMQQTLDGIWPQVEAMQAQLVDQLTGPEIDAEFRAALQTTLDRSNARLREALSWEKVQPVYRDIYQQTFDAGDVQAMTEFYASPTGQRVIEKTPQLMANTMAATQQLMMPLLQQMERDLQEAAAAREGDGAAP